MSSTSVLSSRERILTAIIIISLSVLFIIYSGFPQAVLFLCGVSTGAILAREFIYNNDQAFDSGEQKGEKFESDSTGTIIRQTLLSTQIGKYLFIGSLLITVYVGGLWGVGIFAGIGPFAESHEIGGEVVDQDGDPLSEAEIRITNESGGDVTVVGADNGSSFYLAETDGDGRYNIELADGDTIYNVSYYDETYEGIEPANTSLDFPKDRSTVAQNENETDTSSSIFPDWMSVIGASSQDTDSENTDSEDENQEDTDDTSPGDDEATTDEPADSQSIPYIEGKLEGENVLVKFVNVTVLDQNGDEIVSTRNESGITGNYRIKNIPPEAFDGDIEDGEVTIQAKSEYKIQTTTKTIDLDIYDAETGVDNVGIEIEEDRSQ